MQLSALKPGDIVDIVAPASACRLIELRRAVAELRRWGLMPRVPPKLFGRSYLFANRDEERLRQLKAAFYARDSKMIWCVRGGYGALRLMPNIRRWAKPKQPKIFLGYSDITTLHVHLNQSWNWPSYHGPLLDRIGRFDGGPEEIRWLRDLLFGERDEFEFSRLRPMNAAARRAKTLRSRILGGNMAVLQSGLGTPSALKPKNCILFFEDIGERPHRMDRMLVQFQQAGWFDQVKAVIFGHLLLADAGDRRILWKDVLPRFAESVKIPVLAGLPVGHNPARQLTLPFNTPCILRLGSSPRLIVESGLS